MILYSTLAAQHINPLPADILVHDKLSSQHPATFHATPPPLPFRDQPVLQRKIFRKLKARERELFQRSLEPLAPWCDQVNGQLSQMSLDSVQGLTDKVLRETANFFDSLKHLKKPSPPSRG